MNVRPPILTRTDTLLPATTLFRSVCRSIARRYRSRRLAFLSWLPELPDDPRSARLIEPQGLRRVVTGYSSAGLDLRRSPEALLAGLHGKWRAALRKAEREGIAVDRDTKQRQQQRSEEHTSELQSLMRISYAVFCLKKKKNSITLH